jgi:hypothetical protein
VNRNLGHNFVDTRRDALLSLTKNDDDDNVDSVIDVDEEFDKDLSQGDAEQTRNAAKFNNNAGRNQNSNNDNDLNNNDKNNNNNNDNQYDNAAQRLSRSSNDDASKRPKLPRQLIMFSLQIYIYIYIIFFKKKIFIEIIK